VDLKSWEGQFPAEPIRVSEARRRAHDAFESWGMAVEQTNLACLLVSEVVTNVVLHAGVSPAPRPDLAFDAARADIPDSPDSPGTPDVPRGWDGPLFPDECAGPSGKEFTLRLRRGKSSIWVEVFDADLRLPRIRSADENDEGGRGLYLVDQLATRWGSRPTKDGKAVWFEMPIREDP